MRYQAPSKATLLATAVFAAFGALTFTYSNPVEMRVDGQPVISDVPPVTTAKDGVYVPLRPVTDALGAQTHYDRKSGDVVVTRGDRTLRLKVGSKTAKLNGMPMSLGHEPFRVRGRVMVGLHAVQRAFDVRVKFNKMTARVDVNTPGVPSNPDLVTQ